MNNLLLLLLLFLFPYFFLPTLAEHETLECILEDEGHVICDGNKYTAEEHYDPPGPGFFVCLFGAIFFICFGGLMSGLTIGFMSLDLTALNVIASTSEDEKERKNVAKILPLLKRHHLLLVTLLLSNAIAMEALPIFLDRIVSSIAAIIISVTAVLVVGEVIPQAICKKYGVAVGANTAWIVKGLMFLFFPICWPISKLLDYVLGETHATYYIRTELKELVKLHGVIDHDNEEPLDHNEINLIRGTLEIHGKTIEEIMTPIEESFLISEDTVLDEKTIDAINEKNYSRIPIYSRNNKDDILGILLFKVLLKIDRKNPPQAGSLALSKILKVQKGTFLFPLLNQFLARNCHLGIVYDGEIPIGIVTMEDIIEEILQHEIENEEIETDVDEKISKLQRANKNRIRKIPSASRVKVEKVKEGENEGDAKFLLTISSPENQSNLPEQRIDIQNENVESLSNSDSEHEMENLEDEALIGRKE